jgi:hypothetical protein
MRLRPSSLIIGSIVVFLLDFLLLANKTIFPDSTVIGFPAVVVAFVCALIFISGIIWAIVKSISGKGQSNTSVTTTSPIKSASTPDRFALTPMEIVFNRIFAILMVITTIPYILNILSLPTIIIYLIFAIFLWFGKKYHLFGNIIFLIFALGIYFVQIPPFAWGFFWVVKEYRLSGFEFSFPIIFLIPQFIFLSFVIRNLIGNIFVRFKTSVSRNTFYLASLFIISVIILAYPLLDSVRLRDRTMNVNTAIGGELPNVYTKQSLTFLDRYHMAGDFTSKFDKSSKKYIYHLQLQEPLKKEIQFTKVETDGEKINFANDSQAVCPNCQKTGDPYGLIFPAGKTIDIIITSDHLVKVIKFTEPGDKVAEFVFWK